MACDAVRLAALPRSAHNILEPSNGLEVYWIDARTVATQVVKLES
jgi:hypothetical protein